MLALLLADPAPVTVPAYAAYAAYAEPDPSGIGIDAPGRSRRWNDPAQALVWYGEAVAPGRVGLSVAALGADPTALTMTVGHATHRGAAIDGAVDFGTFDVAKGPVRAALRTASAPGPDVEGLSASGPRSLGHEPRGGTRPPSTCAGRRPGASPSAGS